MKSTFFSIDLRVSEIHTSVLSFLKREHNNDQPEPQNDIGHGKC